MIDKIKQALDDIRPSLQADGGDIEFIDFKEDGIVEVKLTGACSGCPMSQITLKQGVEKYLIDTIPEVKAVEAVD